MSGIGERPRAGVRVLSTDRISELECLRVFGALEEADPS
jgi:hypothetical protein